MIWFLVGLAVGVYLGFFLCAMLDISHHPKGRP